MSIDFWGLGLQAINVLILIWLLSRVFWQPMSAAIENRQKESYAQLEASQVAKSKAEAILAELTQARAGIDSERDAVLLAARTEAEDSTRAALAKAQKSAEETIETAHATIKRDIETADKANAAKATELSFHIAASLLERLNSPTVQAAFLDQLLEAIHQLPATDRESLNASPLGLDLVSAGDLGVEREKFEASIQSALGSSTPIRWVIDPKLIAGLELHSPHFVLRNSWQADLTQVQKAVSHES